MILETYFPFIFNWNEWVAKNDHKPSLKSFNLIKSINDPKYFHVFN